MDNFEPFRPTGGNVVCLIFGLDYKYSEFSLTGSVDARAIYRIIDRSSYDEAPIRVVLDNNKADDPNVPTRKVFLKNLKEQARKCRPGDWFIFFFAGHGGNVPDRNGDEASGMDQAFMLPDKRMRLTNAGSLIDDEFALALDTYVPPGVRILVLCDCCHSGTICDIDSFNYEHEIYQISATQDSEEAEDSGMGGLFTACLKQAIKELSLTYNNDEFSIARVFEKSNELAESKTDEQHLSFQWSGQDPDEVAWPLCFPWIEYLSKPASSFWKDDKVEVTGEPTSWA